MKTIHGGQAPGAHKIATHKTAARKRGRGAPKGNLNALKHGRYRREMRALRKFVRARLRRAARAIADAAEFRKALAAPNEKGEP